MSIIFNGIPSITTVSSIISLVVPSIAVTIALSSCKIAFNKEDFPTFGFPIIAVFIPSFKIFPSVSYTHLTLCVVSVFIAKSIACFSSSDNVYVDFPFFIGFAYIFDNSLE